MINIKTLFWILSYAIAVKAVANATDVMKAFTDF